VETLTRGTDQIALHHHPLAADPGDAPLAVLVPAMGVPARYYAPFAAELNRAGFAVTAMDLRGTGASTPRPGRASGYGLDDVVSDVDAVLDLLAKRDPARRFLLVGHSLGGQACLLHLARHPGDARIDAVALIATGTPYWRGYGWQSPLVYAYCQTINLISAALGYWPGWGFGGRQARGVIRDWAYTARHGRYPRRGDLDIEAALRDVTTPILAVSIEPDRFCPAPTVDHLVGKVTAASVVREHYTSAQAGRPLTHFSWVRASAPLADRIALFLTHHTR